jgi:hypothetical protein
LSRPHDHDLPFSTWSLTKLADYLVAEGVVEDISHEGLRLLLREEGVSFQVIKTWKPSTVPDFEAKKNRVLELYAIADGEAEPGEGDPTVVICCDEFGPLNLQPHPGKQWALRGGMGSSPRRRRRATYTRPHGVRHLLAGYDLSRNKLYGQVKTRKGRTEFLAFCRYLAASARRADRHRAGQLQPRTGPPPRTHGSVSGLPRTTSSWLRALLRLLA